mgnify:CR=1 FL=1
MWDRIKSWLAWLGAALLALLTLGLVGRRRAERPVGREVDKALEDTRAAAGRAGDVIAEETAAREERLRQHQALTERLRDLSRRGKRLPVILLLALVLTLAAPVSAQQIPGDYEQLADLYLEAVEIAAAYKALYEQAEASNARLLAELDALRQQVELLTATVERQQALIERQQNSILGLLGGLSLEAGVEAQSLSPITITPFLRVAYRF